MGHLSARDLVDLADMIDQQEKAKKKISKEDCDNIEDENPFITHKKKEDISSIDSSWPLWLF